MLPILLALLVLFAVVAVVGLAAPRVRLPVPVLLALVGILLGVLPGIPRLPLHPDLILMLFLPPLLYADAFKTSWVDFRRWLRPIVMLAVGLVAFTIVVVGIVAHAVLPELPWVACFVLGAVVSPTDTVAVQAVIERLRIPRRMTAVLGGESLVNDATGLVGVQVGVAVVATGTFEAGPIALEFLRVAGAGIATGLAVGTAFAWINRWVRDTPVLFVLSLLSPYLAFFVAHELGASGVLAVVVAGFIVSWRIHHVPPDARVELFTTWELLVFLLNGMCFVFIGLETPSLLMETGAGASTELWVAGLAVSAAVIFARIVWCFPGAYVPLSLLPRLRQREGGYPPARNVLLVAWCGVRGVVSLAAALSLPATIEDGSPFPGRREILACTLCVILVTLLVQSTTLQPLIRWLGIRDEETTESEVRAAREALLRAGIARLDEFCSQTSCPISVHHFRNAMADELTALLDADAETRERARSRLSVSLEVRRAVAQAQERTLLALRDRGALNDRTYLDLQLELDRSNLNPVHRPS